MLSLLKLKTRVNKLQISKVEISVFLIMFLFGIPMMILIPPGAGYDEEDHLVRVWELSAFSFIPGQMSPQEMKYPTIFRDFAYRQQGSTGTIRADFWQRYARASLYEHGFVHRELNTKSVYSPALLFPQAIVMRFLGRNAGLPALPVFYSCRFATLLSYLLLIWLAMRSIPFGKWVLLVLAASPMALFQAATISPDAVSNGIGFLFIAGCLQAAQFEQIGWRETGKLIVLICLLFLAKLNLLPLILIPFLLIWPSRFTQKRVYLFLLSMAVILFLIEVGGWNIIATRHSNALLANGANPRAQVSFILGHPLAFVQTMLKDLPTNGWVYIQGWINGYGYYYWTPPLLVSLIFLLSLVFALLLNRSLEHIDKQYSIVFVLIFLAGYLATVVPLYVTFTPVGLDQVQGVQGRYFIPLALPLLLTLSSLSWTTKLASLSSRWTLTFLTIALSLNVLGILLAFHVPCGATFYETGLCYRPLFRDFPSDTHLSPPVSKEMSLTQEIRVTCDGLTELRLLTDPSIPEDKGLTHFILQDPGQDRTIADSSTPNTQVSGQDWYLLSFQPDWQSSGKRYILKISGVNTSADQGLRFLYTTQSEFDLGDLYENGQLLQEDIVLQYGCATGLRKIWPTGKP